MQSLFKLQPGAAATVQKVVTEADTALHFGSGALKTMFATPVLVAFVVEAAVRAVDPKLPDGFVTVSTGFNFKHTVTVQAVLEQVQDNRLFFRFKAYDEIGEIGQGTHERAVVSLKGIMKSAEKRREQLKIT